MGLTLLTAVFGGFDSVRPAPAGFSDCVLVTDDPDIIAPGWRVIVEPIASHPRLAAKRPKLTPWEYVDGDSVWVDGSCEVGPDFREWVDSQPDAELLAWRHPEARDCLFEEAVYCQDWPKYQTQPIRHQVALYRAEGMPENFGLFACGVLIWRHTPAAKLFGDRWLLEQSISIQDQISLPFLLWQDPISFATFNSGQYSTPCIRWHQHNRPT